MKKIIFTIIFVFYFVLSFSQNYKEVITIGTVTDAAPYCFKDEKGNFDGYSVDIIKTIMFRLGYEFMFKELARVSLQMQGNNVLNEVILSQCDLSLMAIPSVAYKRNHYFSTPYSMVNYLVISRGDNLFGGLKDLISKDIIVQKNSEAERRMSTLKDGYISNLIKVQTVPSGIKMLKEGVGDFMVIDDHVIESFRRSIKNNDLHISLSNFDPLNISVASNNGELIRRINFILEGMRNDGTLNRLYKKWIEVDIDKDYSYYFFAILLFLLAIIAFTLIIIFILGKVVKKAEERAFKALNKNYELVFAINLLLKNSDTDILMYDEITHQLYILINGEFTIAKEDFEDLKSRIHQDDFEQWKVDYFNIITAKVDFVTTKLRVFNQQTQSYDYFEYTVTHAEKNQDGKVARFYYSRRNITALMQDIRKKERVISSFNLAMSSANIIRWRLHIKDKTVKLNFSDGKELLFDTQYLLGVVDLSDKEIIKKYILESINGIQQSDIIIKGKYDNYVDYRICKISSLIQRDIDGKPENIYGVINDITDISQSHQKQEELQQSLQSALDAGQMTAWRYDREDDSFISLYGPQINNGHMTMEEYISFVHQVDKDVFPNALQSILNGEIKSATVNFRLKTNSQNYRWYICTLMPIIECAKIKYVTGTRRDITSDMESRIELEQAIIKAEKLNIQQNSYNQLLTTIIEKFPGVLFIKDVNDDFRYLFASTEFCNSSARLPREKIIGHTDFEIYKDYNIASKFRNDDIRVVNLPKGEVVEIGEERLYIDG